MADAFLQFVVENLNTLIRKEVGLIWGVDKELKTLSSLLSTIQAVLEDAEEKQVRDKALQNWLRKLKAAAYKVDDILDEFATEAARLGSYGQDSSLINKVRTSFLNPRNIPFRHKIGSRIRDIKERLDEIAKERSQFHLKEGGAERRTHVIEDRQTGSILTQPKVYGRDEDKERVIQCLAEGVASLDVTSVYPIVGLGGLGKTTLAQVIFNDERIRSHFDLRIWVCVSVDFKVRGIIKAIIEAATGSTCGILDLEPLQRRLQEVLKEKRYLLVLDDVWSDDQEEWDRLKYVLACGSRGASIIVTTRIVTVASTMGTMPLHQLCGLNEDDCWSLFRERAFRQTEEHSNLVALGKEIVKKCAGVPLAIKSLGSMMSNKIEESQWLSVVNSDLWNLPQPENSIMPALRLSYSNLPSQLKQCFAYCAIFPKDFLIEKELLIQLWMANGFIPLTGKLDPEVICNEIFNELCWRSFFQESEEYDIWKIEGFKMHDLIHDLALSIMEDECLNTMVASSTGISERTSHFAVLGEEMSSCSFPEALYQVETLRTFLMHTTTFYPHYKVSCDFSRLHSLRVLSTRHAELTKLPSSFSCLPHLRYLDLSHTKIQKLPESIVTLYNLQTLKLERCYSLQELPKRMRLLKNLRHLHLPEPDYSKLSQMPPQIGQITCLKTLTCFIVGEKRGCHLEELKSLNLGGSLHIEHLERVKNPLDAKEANLVGKQNLHQLYLSWKDKSDHQSLEDVEKVLEALQPHANLKKFFIWGYKGAQFPSWIRHLSSLETLYLSNCPELVALPDGIKCLTSLRSLTIQGCKKLTCLIEGIQHLSSLETLYLSNCPELVALPDGIKCLTSLRCLDIVSCKKLTCLTEGIQHLSSLETFTLYDCPELVALPDGIKCLTSLRRLTILGCKKLTCLTEGIQHLSSLEILSLYNCPELVALPDGIKCLTSLRCLTIGRCLKLKKRCEKERGEDWYKIAHIPNVVV